MSLVKKVIVGTMTLGLAAMININCAMNSTPNVDEVKQENTEVVEEAVMGGEERFNSVKITSGFFDAEEGETIDMYGVKFNAEEYRGMQGHFKEADLVAKVTFADREIFFNRSLKQVGIKFHFEDAVIFKYLGDLFRMGVESYPFDTISYDLAPQDLKEVREKVLQDMERLKPGVFDNMETITIDTPDLGPMLEKGMDYILFAENNIKDGITKHRFLASYVLSDKHLAQPTKFRDMLSFVMRDYVDEKEMEKQFNERKNLYDRSDLIIIGDPVSKEVVYNKCTKAPGNRHDFENVLVFKKDGTILDSPEFMESFSVMFNELRSGDVVPKEVYDEMIKAGVGTSTSGPVMESIVFSADSSVVVYVKKRELADSKGNVIGSCYSMINFQRFHESQREKIQKDLVEKINEVYKAKK